MSTKEKYLSEKFKLYSGYDFKLFSAKDQNTPVLLKVAKNSSPLTNQWLASEYEFTQTYSHLSVTLNPLSISQDSSNSTLVFEHFEGQTFRQVLNRAPLSITNFFKIAKNLAALVQELHQNNIIHGQLNPSNILYNESDHSVKVFGLNPLYSNNYQQIFSDDHKNLSIVNYMAPELDNQLSAPITTATDLYSLGMIFLELLKGSPSIQANVKQKLNMAPIPNQLSSLILKLIDPLPTKRYQSCKSLLKDLSTCQSYWTKSKTISPFKLGQQDLTQHLNSISHQLFKRPEKLEKLSQALKQVSQGEKLFLTVSGEPGVGKSHLLKDFTNLINQEHFVLQINFQHIKEHPNDYHVFQQLLKALIQQLLMKDQALLNNWKSVITQTLGSQIELLYQLEPDIAKICHVKKFNLAHNLPVQDVNSIFKHTLYQMISLFGAPQNPLILIIEHLDKASTSMLDILKDLLTFENLNYALIIGTTEMRYQGEAGVKVHLSNISYPQLETFLQSTFNLPAIETKVLHQILWTKSKGNPLYIQQLLQTLANQSHLYFDYTLNQWFFNASIQLEFNYPDLYTLFEGQTRSLKTETYQLLKYASCFGQTFSLNEISSVLDSHSITQALCEALQQQLIINETSKLSKSPLKFNPSFRFIHPLLREALYTQLNEQQKNDTHLQIGLYYSKTLTPENSENIYKTLYHLNAGRQKNISPECQFKLAQLHCQAGQLALQQNDFFTAYNTFHKGLSYLPPNHWKQNFELSYKLYLFNMEYEFIYGSQDMAHQYFLKLLDYAPDFEEKCHLYFKRIELATNLSQYDQALKWGEQALQLFAIPFNSEPGKLDVLALMAQVKYHLSITKINQLLHYKSAPEQNTHLLMKLLMHLFTPAYFTNKNLSIWLTLTMVLNSLKKGHTSQSAFAYATYSMLICNGFNQFKQGFELAQVALKLTDKYPDPLIKNKVLFGFSAFINPGIKPLKSNEIHLNQAIESSITSGDLTFYGYSMFGLINQKLIRGENLYHIQQIIDFYQQKIQTSSQSFASLALKISQEHIQELKGLPSTLSEVIKSEDKIILHWQCILQMINAYHQGDYHQALELAQRSKTYLESSFAQIYLPEHYFYYGLTLAAIKPAQTNHHIEFKHCLKQLKKWSTLCPDNLESKYLLLKAEWYRIKNHKHTARTYRHALNSSQNQSISALICERMVNYYGQANDQVHSSFYFQQAHTFYKEWGAHKLINILKERYKQFFNVEGSPQFVSADQKEHSSGYHSLIKTLQTLSEETYLPNLIKIINSNLQNYSSADTGAILLFQKGRLLINSYQSNIYPTISLPQELHSNSPLPLKLIHYVSNTHQTLCFNYEEEQYPFNSDLYFANHHPQSILCLPILKHKHLLGIIYLENQNQSQIFSPEQVETLKLLTAQIAISIENAQLYNHLEHKVDIQTQKLKNRIQQLKWTNQELLSAKQLAEQASMAKSQFLDKMSHELRTPLNHILGFSELILEGLEDEVPVEEIQSDAQKVIQSSQDLLTLVEASLALSENENIQLNNEPIILSDLLSKLKPKIKQMLTKNQNQLEIICNHPQMELINDIQKLELILNHLLTNACKFTKEGQIQLKIESIQKNKSHWIHFIVSDTGIGIEQEKLAHIFDSFYQVDSTAKSLYSGAGLGLAVCQKYARLMGGDITVNSELNQGSSFTLEIPTILPT